VTISVGTPDPMRRELAMILIRAGKVPITPNRMPIAAMFKRKPRPRTIGDGERTMNETIGTGETTLPHPRRAARKTVEEVPGGLPKVPIPAATSLSIVEEVKQLAPTMRILGVMERLHRSKKKMESRDCLQRVKGRVIRAEESKRIRERSKEMSRAAAAKEKVAKVLPRERNRMTGPKNRSRRWSRSTLAPEAITIRMKIAAGMNHTPTGEHGCRATCARRKISEGWKEQVGEA